MNAISKNENLYRAIKRSKPNSIQSDGKISSALFKADIKIDTGVSVDRNGGRSMDQVILAMKKNFDGRLKGIASLIMEVVISAQVYPEFAVPKSSNPYHVNLYKNNTKEPLSSLQALKLADACKLEYQDEQVNWT